MGSQASKGDVAAEGNAAAADAAAVKTNGQVNNHSHSLTSVFFLIQRRQVEIDKSLIPHTKTPVKQIFSRRWVDTNLKCEGIFLGKLGEAFSIFCLPLMGLVTENPEHHEMS